MEDVAKQDLEKIESIVATASSVNSFATSPLVGRDFVFGDSSCDDWGRTILHPNEYGVNVHGSRETCIEYPGNRDLKDVCVRYVYRIDDNDKDGGITSINPNDVEREGKDNRYECD